MLIIITIVLLLILSAILSGSETAFFNLKIHRKNISNNVKQLLVNPRKLLVAFLTGNTIVNVALASLATFITIEFANTNQLNERILLENKTEAFQFLSTYHHQLHIMIGEEEGDGELAYKEFLNALMDNDNNELIPIKNAAIRIGNYTSISESVKRLDYLVDYYQSGLSMEIEGILRGYGYLQNFSTDSVLVLYDKLVKQE